MSARETLCPICSKRLELDDPDKARFRPFCSKRCQLLDLSRWFNEEYRISTPAPPTETPHEPPN